MALLNVDKLSVHFGDEGTPFRAVDRISYSVNQGEVVGIVGESGSGKSVSSLAIMGLIDYPGRVMADKLEFNGRDLQRISEKERRQLVGAEVAMIFQDPMTSLNPSYTVGFQIMEVLRLHQGLRGSALKARATTLRLPYSRPANFRLRTPRSRTCCNSTGKGAALVLAACVLRGRQNGLQRFESTQAANSAHPANPPGCAAALVARWLGRVAAESGPLSRPATTNRARRPCRPT